MTNENREAKVSQNFCGAPKLPAEKCPAFLAIEEDDNDR
jgi:DNA-binding transcriptional regulator YdaS (Cro superfamily)